MSDLRDSLDREASTIRADSDALGAVRRRAARHRRVRRGIAGAVAIAIGAAGIGLAYTAFAPDRSRRPATEAGTTRTDLPIWPDGPEAELDRTQQSVDDGHQPWYLSPRLVAEVFAMEVMHWEREDVRVQAADPEARGVAVASISNPALASEAGTPTVTTVLEMERWRGRPDGIFVITKATSDVISIERPLQYEDFGPAPVFEGDLGLMPDGILAVGTWKHDLSRFFAFTHPKEHFNFKFREDGPWASHAIASVRLIHAPGFWPPSDAESEELDSGLDGPVIAISAYRLGEYLPDPQESPRPDDGGETPVPGPTPTSDETASSLSFEIFNATGLELDAVVPYSVLLFEEARSLFISDAEEARSTSQIFCAPANRDEAERIREALLPGAEIGSLPADAQADIQIVLGQDYAEREGNGIRAYELVRRFMGARHNGEGAERFLTRDAEGQYQANEGGLSLYGYTQRSHDVTSIQPLPDSVSTFVVVVRIPQGGDSDFYETLHVGTASIEVDGTLGKAVLYAERNE